MKSSSPVRGIRGLKYDMKYTKGYSFLPRTLSSTRHLVDSFSTPKKFAISSLGFWKLMCSSKLRIEIPNIFISCEKLSQFCTPPTIPLRMTFVPTPFFLDRRPSNTNLLIACLNVFRDIFNCSDNSTSFGRSFPFLYSSDSMSCLNISSA